MGLPDFFALHPVFRRETLDRHLVLASGQAPSRDSVEELLRYHQRTGRIMAVRRGLYATVPPGGKPESAPVDAYLAGTLGCPGGVLGYHTALELHGLAYSSFEVIQILVPRQVRGWQFRGVTYCPIRPRHALGAEAFRLGVEQMDRRGIDIQVTTQSRTLVDVLDRPDLGGGWEEVWRSLESIRWVDLNEITTYLRRLGNATTSAKVGHFLEQHQSALHVEETDLKALESLRPKVKQYLDRGEKGRLSRRWNLIVPEVIWNRAWEEPG